MNRKIGVVILALVAVLSLSLFACNTTKPSLTKAEALQSYIFSLEDSVVKEDFTLPRRIGDYRAEWTSDSEYVVLTKKTDNYLATVTIPEEDVEVNLTVDLRGASDTYKIRLQAITAQDFVESYSFAQNRGTVYNSFDLDTEATYKGRTATITWSVDDDSYIEIDGNKCVVKPSSLNPTVMINATFTYKGESITTFYTFTVSEQMEHLQEVNYWYTNTGVSITMKGYVVAIATAWSSQYENVSLYMVDENLDAGYYLYRVGCNAANAAKLVPGVYLTVEGTTNTLYNGLYETNSDGDITSVDETKTIDLATTYYALDNDVLAGAPATNYNQSRLVSLTNWTVDEVKTTVDENKNATLFVLKKGDKKVSVAVSKYMEGVYAANSTDATYVAIINKYKTVQVGDVVSVKGLLGNYNGAQIMPLSADEIVIGGEVGENDTAIGSAVANAMAEVDQLFDLDEVITKPVEVTLTEAIEGVTTTYTLLGTRTAFSIADNTLAIVPGAAEIATIQVTFEYQGYTTNVFYNMRAEDLDEQGKADWEIENFEVVDSIKKEGEYDLPDVKFFKSEEDGAAKVVWTTNAPYATVKGTVLTLAGLPLEADTLKLTATVTVGEATSTRDYFVDVAAYDATKPVYVESAPEAGTYLALVVKQENLGQYLYATNTLSGNYLSTTTDYTTAAQVVLTAVEGGYTIQLGGKYLELVQSGTYVNVAINDTATEGFVWTWNDEYNTFVATVDGVEKYVGAYNTFNTYSASNLSYAKTSFPSHLVSEVQVQTAQDILDGIKLDTIVAEDFSLDYKATWEVIGGTAIVIDGLTAKVTQGATAQTVTMEATLTYGGVTATKEFTFTIPALNPAPVDGEYVYGLYQAGLEKTLYLTSEKESFYYKTTTDPLKAAKVVLTSVEGGYTILVDGKYMELTGSYGNITLLDEPTSVWAWNNGFAVMTFTNSYGTFFVGTRNTYNTLGGYKIENITNDSYYASTFQRPAPLAGEYIYGLYQANTSVKKTLYANGSLSGRFLATTENVAEAAKFTVAVSGEGYTITVGGKYVEVGNNSDNKTSIFLKDTSSAVWTWNEEAGVMTFKFNNNNYYLGTYNTNTTISPSSVTYLTNDLSAIGKTQFICKFEYAPATTGGETGGTEGGETITKTASIDFTTTAARKTFEEEQQIWESNGVKLLNEKANSTTACTNHTSTGHVRLYKDSSITVSCDTNKIKKIVLTYTASSYDGGFSTGDNIVVTTSSKTITITFAEAVNSWTYSLSSKQLRLTKLTVEIV